MLNATITVNQNSSDLKEIFLLEDKTFQNNRASYKVEKIKDKLVFNIQAKDSVALRSVLNTITKIITVYEKAKTVIENDKSRD